MYLEIKSDGLRGEGRIGRVGLSKTGKTLYYGERTLIPTKGSPLKANYYDQETLEDFWVSNPKKDGKDSLFPSIVNIDKDVREEYWISVRGTPEKASGTCYRSLGKTKAEREKLEKGLRRRQMDNAWMPN